MSVGRSFPPLLLLFALLNPPLAFTPPVYRPPPPPLHFRVASLQPPLAPSIYPNVQPRSTNPLRDGGGLRAHGGDEREPWSEGVGSSQLALLVASANRTAAEAWELSQVSAPGGGGFCRDSASGWAAKRRGIATTLVRWRVLCAHNVPLSP